MTTGIIKNAAGENSKKRSWWIYKEAKRRTSDKCTKSEEGHDLLRVGHLTD